MKKIIFTLLLSLAFISSFSQSTYYWVGGAIGAWTSPSSWSSSIGGAGNARVAPASTDILIFDGRNIGAGAIGNITTEAANETIGQLKLDNNADLSLARNSAGSSFLTIGGNSGNDLNVNNGSKLSVTGNSGSMAIVIAPSTTGNIYGNIFITGTAANRLSIQGTAKLNFWGGSFCTVNSGTNPFSTTTIPLNPSVDKAVAFQMGSSLVFQGGSNPFGSSTTNIIYFLKGSKMILESSNVTNMFINRFLGNVEVRNNTTIALSENFYTIDTLVVNSGSSFLLPLTGTSPFTGNIINNGTFGGATGYTTTHCVMIGTAQQTILGSGIFNGLGALSVATDADLTMGANLRIGSSSTTANTAPTSIISGKLNLQNYTLSSTGFTTDPGNVFFKGAASAMNVAATLTNGSNIVTLNSGNYNASNVVIGTMVSGNGIPANSYIISTNNSSYQFTISKAATSTSATDAALLTISNDNPIFVTTNIGGIDGSITTIGTKTFSAGTNYFFSAPTITPFSNSNGTTTTIGSITFSANVTTNKSIIVTGTMTLNNSKLTIRAGDTVHISSGNTITGSVGPSSYIIIDKNGGSAGYLKITNFAIPKTFPIGTATNYLPVVLTPTTLDGYNVSVFEGITADGTPNGTPFTPAQKATVVDAVWVINRTTTNTNNCTMILNWTSNLEGSTFATYANSNLGIARYTGSWGASGGSGDNIANTATHTFNAFSSFGVGQIGNSLPVKLTNPSAKQLLGAVQIQWNTEAEIDVDNYTIERSSDGISFYAISSVPATGSRQYSVSDNAPLNMNYYRIKVMNKNGTYEISAIVKVKLNNDKSEINVFPNPIIGEVVSLQLVNLVKGKTAINIYNNQGQQILSTMINYEGGNQLQKIVMPRNIAKGIYRLVVINNSNNLQQTLFVE